MSWEAHGTPAPASAPGGAGIFLTAGATNTPVQSKTVPAVAAYRGRLWCLWADFDGQLWYAATTAEGGGGSTTGDFGERIAFPQSSGSGGNGGGLPVLANLNGHLHAIIARAGEGEGNGSGEMEHYLYDDEEAQAWKRLDGMDLGTDTGMRMTTRSTPGLVAFHNKLFLAFLGGEDARLYFAVWTNATAHPTSASDPRGTWSAARSVTSDEQTFGGIPALFAIDGVLHLLCATATGTEAERGGVQILGYRYDYAAATWTQCDDVTEGRAARGVSAASYGDSAYLGFIEDGPTIEAAVEGNQQQQQQQHDAVYVVAYRDGKWQPHEAVVDAQQQQQDVTTSAAADPPQLAVLNGRVHCIFAANTATRDLRWYSRAVLGYSLSSWMAGLADETPLSSLTIPGTHDSCARSNIPFVRTQYLSVAQQLHLGIRFLDLRLRRREKDDRLFCYHGGIPLNLPLGLAFSTVMDEVFAFLDASPSETVLVSINNDDTSPAQRADPGLFYRAVVAAISATQPRADGTPRWAADPMTPGMTLGQARGRAVLLRRFRGPVDVLPSSRAGLDLSGWQDDDPYFVIDAPTGVRVHLQDKWKFAERVALADLVARKHLFVRRMMGRAAGDAALFLSLDHDDNDGSRDEEGKQGEEEEGQVEELEEIPDSEWIVNFCSAVGDPLEHGEIAEAKWIAVGAHSDWRGHWVDGMNVRTRRLLLAAAQQALSGQEEEISGRRTRRLGIVNLDYPELPMDNDLVARLIEMNF